MIIAYAVLATLFVMKLSRLEHEAKDAALMNRAFGKRLFVYIYALGLLLSLTFLCLAFWYNKPLIY